MSNPISPALQAGLAKYLSRRGVVAEVEHIHIATYNDDSAELSLDLTDGGWHNVEQSDLLELFECVAMYYA